MVPYVVGTVVTVTVMRVLLSCGTVSMLRESVRVKGDVKSGVGDGGCVAAVSAGPEYVDGTLGSSIVCCAADVLGMSGEKCVKCVYDWGGVGGDMG